MHGQRSHVRDTRHTYTHVHTACRHRHMQLWVRLLSTMHCCCSGMAQLLLILWPDSHSESQRALQAGWFAVNTVASSGIEEARAAASAASRNKYLRLAQNRAARHAGKHSSCCHKVIHSNYRGSIVHGCTSHLVMLLQPSSCRILCCAPPLTCQPLATQDQLRQALPTAQLLHQHQTQGTTPSCCAAAKRPKTEAPGCLVQACACVVHFCTPHTDP